MFETPAFGKVLVLDGVVQCTDHDEFSYQEMLAHVPMRSLSYPNPTHALVVGGGDGGVLRELGRYPSLTHIHCAELDGLVIETAKTYFPRMAVGFADIRVTTYLGDGTEFVRNVRMREREKERERVRVRRLGLGLGG